MSGNSTPKSNLDLIERARLLSLRILGDLKTAIKTKDNTILTNQMSSLLLNEWPKAIAKIVFFSLQL